MFAVPVYALIIVQIDQSKSVIGLAQLALQRALSHRVMALNMNRKNSYVAFYIFH
jgi:hypothetical protein